ncbi:hypothetical protein GCM10008111_25030 [Alishewanella tabrizica]|uniref:Transposase n=1 Tax=Alishewanella tabrizica TaxID=671278 RepID=A0ABQ2WUA6_9ALTE|nr:hypothetical protein GCM10008111_25030 [Alishewanella tabrizica]
MLTGYESHVDDYGKGNRDKVVKNERIDDENTQNTRTVSETRSDKHTVPKTYLIPAVRCFQGESIELPPYFADK